MKRAALIFGLGVSLTLIATVSNNSCMEENRNYYLNATYSFESYFYTRDCECDNEHICIRKCCDINYFLHNFTCVYNDTIQLEVPPVFKYRNVLIEDNLNIRFIPGMINCPGNGSEFLIHSLDVNFIQNDGRLWVSEINTYFDYEHYCMDYNLNYLEPVVCYCFTPYEANGLSLYLSYRVTFIGMLISLPFLLATFLVYAILPLRNVHGKSLMCYVFSLFWAYLIQVVAALVHVEVEVSTETCRVIAMGYFYFFIASFFWMNVMSIDIWWTFSKPHGSLEKRKGRKRFLFYSAYAWGSPLLLVILILTLSKIVKPNTWYNPGIIESKCFLSEGIPRLLYYYLPKATIIIINISLFAITASRMGRVFRETSLLKKDDNRKYHESDTQRYKLYIKLFLAMGLNWSMEVITWAVNWQVEHVPRAVWYLTDFCNAAFGVFIFFIFVFKRSIWRLLNKRFPNTRLGRPSSGKSGESPVTIKITETKL